MPKRPTKTSPLQPGIVYGPIHSRRFGNSLGINILPLHYKLCSFNCVYCQYGWTRHPTLNPTEALSDLPTPQQVAAAVEKALRDITRHRTHVDSITFSGNGEPTLHPKFGEIVDVVKGLRNQYLPQVNLTVLSNSSTIERPEIQAALQKFDQRVMKLDAGSEEMVCRLNGPVLSFCIRDIVAALKQQREIIIQSMFVQGRVTNTDPVSIDPWLDHLTEIQPKLVQVYTLDRQPAEERLWNVNVATLEWIVSQVRWRAGIQAEMY